MFIENFNEQKTITTIVELIEATSSEDFEIAILLFKEYASQLPIDLEFQNFSEEIKHIESQYARPKGVLFIARDKEGKELGCFGIRALEGSICELKRMYVKPEARGLGIGKLMLEKSLEIGKELGYQKMRLDTLPTMHKAICLYEKVGFYAIEPYRFNPVNGTKYFQIDLIK